MINRNAIRVWQESNLEQGIHPIHISVKIGEKEYEVSYTNEEARRRAIPMLAEKIMSSEIGITEHDILMKVYHFESADV